MENTSSDPPDGMAPTTNHAGKRPADPVGDLRIFVRHAPPAHRSFLWQLVHLDVWGDTLRVPRIADEMIAGYVILGVVFIFEVTAWSMLFNYVLHGAKLAVSALTIPAIGLGLLWGTGVFTVDKGLITADLMRTDPRKWLGFVGRIVLMLFSAGLTAQPLEQYVFRDKIEDRLKQETVRREAINLLPRLGDSKEDPAERVKLADSLVAPQVKERGDVARATKDRHESDLALKVREIEKWRRSRDWARTEQTQRCTGSEGAPSGVPDRKVYGCATLATLESNYRQRLAEAERDRKELIDRVATAGAAVTAAEVARHSEFDKERKELEKKHADPYRLISALSDAAYGAPVFDAGDDSGKSIVWIAADFIERDVVLGRLRAGQPARWPEVSETDRRRAAEAFHMNASDAATDGSAISWRYRILMVIAGAIPLLSLFFKFTMSEELKTYYSVEHQAAAGNADALTVLNARRRRTG